ncbi:MAG: serine/threonine protein kinase [Phycisphaerales bacterium]|nr:MAG: serine/threonine protein kinase [Phycisphaerales bacterium]
MKDDSSASRSKPDKLDRLVFQAMEESEPEADVTRSASVDMLVEKVGGWVDQYKLIDVLGEGGMGIVYLAEQKEPIRRRVALKVIKPGMDSKRVIARFEAERQALALLDHPNIAQVYDAGTTDSGRPYFVMEHVQGLPVTEYCDQHKLSIEDRLILFRQVCDAVQHAHQKGIIHRDIKPSNILVFAEQDKAIPKIIDFGIAKAISLPLTERTVFTEDTQLLGTPEYMSPEQADMATEDIDTRSDVYSLGVLLYVLLTGVMPFDPEALREGGLEHIRKLIRETDPKTPSTRLSKLGDEAATVAQNRRTQIRTLAKHLRKELEWIPLKAMRKERAERYRSASELADDIENYLTGSPLIAGPPSTTYRLKKFVRRHGTLSGAVLAVAVTLIIGLVATTAMYLRSERALGEARAVADFLTQDVLGAIGKAESYETTVGNVLDIASNNLEGKFADQPLVEAYIRARLGWTYHQLGEPAKAERHIERTLRLYEQHFGEEHRRTLGQMHNLGWVYLAQVRLDDAYRIWTRALEIVRRKRGNKSALNNALGCLCSGMGKYEEAEALFLDNVGADWPERAEVREYSGMNLARVYYRQGRYEEAERLFLKLPGIANAEQDRGKLQYTTTLADVYRAQGRYKEAEQLYKTNLEKQRQVLGEDHNNTVATMVHLARLYTEQQRYEEAELLFRQALDSRRRKLAGDHPDTLHYMHELAVLHMLQNRYGEAEPLLIEALEGRRLKLGDEHPQTLESWNKLIELYDAWSKPEKADKWRAKLPQAQAVDE